MNHDAQVYLSVLVGIAIIIAACAWASGYPSECESKLVQYTLLTDEVECAGGARADVLQQGDKLFLRCTCPATGLPEGALPPAPEPESL